MATRGVIQLPQGFDAKHRVRSKDPYTSLLAAQKAAKASAVAVAEVARVMMDGKLRIDEEICARCKVTGYDRSLSTIQHARLVLSDNGMLLWTGVCRKTAHRCSSREWVWDGAPGADMYYEAFKKGYSAYAEGIDVVEGD